MSLRLFAIKLILALSITSTSHIAFSTPTAIPLEQPIFQDTHVYFIGGDNQRKRMVSVTLPAKKEGFDTAILTLDLSCPKNRCDWWDRLGYLTAIDDQGNEIELMRFMTPYRVGATWQLDISDYLPLLSGKRTFQVFIDTWVGPGHRQGQGWIVNASIAYSFEGKSRQAIEVIPVISPNKITYGNPEQPAQLAETLMTTHESDEIRLIANVTGHGQGNTENCAEFCPKNHSFTVNGQEESIRIWRDNCDQTKTKGTQKGTWKYPRAGWCPGDKVQAIAIDFSRDLNGPISFTWQPEDYENKKRGDYNNGGHTEPYYLVSASLIIYK